MQFNIYDESYSQNSHQHVSAGILAILRVILLYKNTKIHVCFTVSTSLLLELVHHTIKKSPAYWIKIHHITAPVINMHILNNFNFQVLIIILF